MALFDPDGEVQLRYDNSTKFATTSSGINVTGTIDADDVVAINSSSTADLRLQYSANNRLLVRAESGSASLVTQNNVDLTLRHDGGTGGGTEIAKISSNGLDIGNNKGINIKDFYGDISARLENSDSTNNSFRIDVDPGASGASSAFLVRIDGNEKLRVLHGGGITFNGDTSSANALDDFEEGSWTPTAQYNTGSHVAVANAVCRYVKIGSLVHVSGRFSLTSDANGGSGELRIGGLPFTKNNPPADGNAAGIQVYVEGAASNITNDITGLVLDGDTQFLIRRSGTTGSGNDFVGLVDAGTTLLVGGTYMSGQ